MASTDIISIGVTTRSRKRARETALHLLPALQDPRDRKKFKAESPPELSQILPITTSPVSAVSLQTNNSSNSNNNSHAHGPAIYQNSNPPPFSDDKKSNVNIPSRSPIQVIDLTVDRRPDISRFTVLLSPNIRITRSAARRAQLQAKLAQESIRLSGSPSGDVVSTPSPDTQHASLLSTTALVSTPPSSSSTLIPQTTSSLNKTAEHALGNSAATTSGSADDSQSLRSQINDVEVIACLDDTNVDINASRITQQQAIPITEDTAENSLVSSEVASDGITVEQTPEEQKSALSGTLDYISPQNSGGEAFPSCNPSPSDVKNTSGSEDHTSAKTPRLIPKAFPSSYLAPNPVRRAPRISTAKRDTARYLLEATEKAALLAYRETRRQFPPWMSNPSRTFFKDSTYIPGGLPIRYQENNDIRVQLNTRMDLGIGTSHFMSSDAFTLPSLVGGLADAFQSSHIQLDPDLDPSPLSMRTSSSPPLSIGDSLGTASSLSSPSFPSDSSSTSAPLTPVPPRTKKGLWYNYALSVQHACQTSSPISCGFSENDDTFSMSFGTDFPMSSTTTNEEGMYDVGKESLDWAAPVPPYYPLTGEHMDSASLPTSSIPSGNSTLGAMNSYFGTDVLPSLEQPNMTTSSLLMEWNMDCINQPPSENGISSFPKTLIDSISR